MPHQADSPHYTVKRVLCQSKNNAFISGAKDLDLGLVINPLKSIKLN